MEGFFSYIDMNKIIFSQKKKNIIEIINVEYCFYETL
jgi:hypothetical protein